MPLEVLRDYAFSDSHSQYTRLEVLVAMTIEIPS